MGRASVNKGVQIGVEVTPGTGVPANKRLPSMSFSMKPNIESKQYRAQGFKFNTVSRVHKLWAEGSLEGPLNFNEIVYPLATLFTPPTPRTPTGGTLSREWGFAPLSQGNETLKTLTVEQGDSIAAQQITNVAATNLSFDFAEDDVMVKGSLIGRAPATGSLTASPTSLAQIIGSARDIDVYLASSIIPVPAVPALATATSGGSLAAGTYTVLITYVDASGNETTVSASATQVTTGSASTVTVTTPAASTGATKYKVYAGLGAGTPKLQNTTGTNIGTDFVMTVLATTTTGVPLMNTTVFVAANKVTDAIKETFEIGKKLSARWVHNTDYTSFKDLVELPCELKASIMSEFNAQWRTQYDTIATNPLQYLGIRIQGPTIEGSIKYLLDVVVAAKVSGTAEEDADGVYAYNFDFAPELDTVLNAPFQMRVINTVTSL